MRWPLALTVVAMSTVAHAQTAPKPSNPAFLGIGMADQQTPIGRQRAGAAPLRLGPCMVTSVMRGSGAMAAGMYPGDLLFSLDGTRVLDCNAVLDFVQGRAPGDVVKVELLRDGERKTINAELISRAEILRRRLVGSPVSPTELYAVDEDDSYNLAANRGKTTIVGWYDPRCNDCVQVIHRVAHWMRAQKDKPGAPLVVYAVNPSVDAKQVVATGAMRSTARLLDVPLALAEPHLYEEFTVPDFERIQFTIVDCRGIVQYVSSVTPNADDAEAALDEMFAAAEQAARTSLAR